MSRILKYLLVGFLAGFTLFFTAFLFFHPLEEAVVMGVVIGAVYALFSLGFMSRLLKTRVLEINVQNKDPQKGMSWYADEIRQQIRDMRFKKVGKSQTLEVYHPVGLYKVLERRIELKVEPYEITVKASSLMIRVFSDLVEIKPVSGNRPARKDAGASQP